MKSKKILFFSILFASIFLLRFFCFQHAFTSHTMPNDDAGHLRLRIFADDMIVDGDQLKARAYDLDHRQKILLYARIQTENEKDFWESNRENLTCLASGRISKPMLPTNFRQFDIRAYFHTQSISNQISNSQLKELRVYKGNNPMQMLIAEMHYLRKMLINKLDKLPQPLSEYAKALLIGDVDSEFYNHYPGVTNLGLIHLFSISGFQVSFFALFLRKLLKKMRFVKEHNLIITAGFLPLFFIFAGSVQSLIRPVAASELSLAASLAKLRIDKETIWAGALMIGLLISPMILFNIGGQLSYLLSFALLYAKRLGPLKTSLFMSAVSMPIILAAKYSWHLLSMPANFVAIPVFGSLILPLIFLALLAQWIFPAALDGMNFVLQLFAAAVEKIADLPGQLYFGKLSDFLVIPLICLIFLMFDKNKHLRWVSTASIVFILTISFFLIHFPKQGELTTFDIGQGDAAFMRTPRNRQSILIDTGGRVTLPKRTWQISDNNGSQGRGVIVNYLRSLGIGRLDYLVLSHGDMDHIGNAKDILNLMPVKNILIPAGMSKTEAFKQQLQPFIRAQTKILEVTDRSLIRDFPFQLLHPFHSGEAENEDSIALYNRLGPLRFFSAGDLPKEGEKQIQERYPSLRVDLLKLGHHGSSTSSEPSILKKWHVAYGLVSAGRHNRYGHPKQDVMALMRKLNIRTFNTQTNGAIRFRYTKNEGFFETFTKNFDDTK